MLEQAFYCLLQFFFSISDSGRRSHPSARVWQLQDKAVPPHAALSHISQTTVCLRNGPHQGPSQSCAALLPGAGGIYSEKGSKIRWRRCSGIRGPWSSTEIRIQSSLCRAAIFMVPPSGPYFTALSAKLNIARWRSSRFPTRLPEDTSTAGVTCLASACGISSSDTV